MDWLRECYQSQWHLFRDSPSTTTTGQYYFSPPGALAYPGWHNLSSRNWHDRNHPIVQTLGEDLAARHLHVDGEFEGQLPLQRSVGSSDEIANGSLVAQAADPDSLFNGYPELCYVPLAPPPNPANILPPLRNFDRASTANRCPAQRLWARFIDWMYQDDIGSITAAVTAFFEEPVSISWTPSTETLPAVLVISAAAWACVCCDGTRHFQTLAQQAFEGVQAPVNRGEYSTLLFWDNGATYVHEKVRAAGITDLRPIFFSGHSYGAAVVLILMARYRFAHADRVIRYLTFGTPKLGDRRLADLIEKCNGMSLANDNDIVTIIPPDRGTMAPLQPFFPVISFLPWYSWVRTPGTVTQNILGGLEPNISPFIDFVTAFNLVSRAVAFLPGLPIVGHPIKEYYRRIELRCPNAGWPVSQEVIDLEDAEDVGPGPELLAGGPTESQDSEGGLLPSGEDVPPSAEGGAEAGGEDVPPFLEGGAEVGGDE